jgi:excisionase family DNA binding protein
VLDVEGAMNLLRIGRNTVYDLVARNEIPHRRLGKQIRFSRAAIMRWLDPWSSQGAKERQ